MFNPVSTISSLPPPKLSMVAFAGTTASTAPSFTCTLWLPCAATVALVRRRWANAAKSSYPLLPRLKIALIAAWSSVAISAYAEPIDNTAVGQGALQGNTGSYNTAVGWYPMSNVNGGNSGNFNVAVGLNALYSNTTGGRNTAVGATALFGNTTGAYNTASGDSALASNTTGTSNTASGASALYGNTTGSNNAASGAFALANNTTGNYNTASGDGALGNNHTGNSNTASGFSALFSNSTGSSNNASGHKALYRNTTGDNNTASGDSALFENTTGSLNTASGALALVGNTTGSSNTANGQSALLRNTTGANNTASGANALGSNSTGNDNVAAGAYALYGNTTGKFNVALGVNAGLSLSTGSNNIMIGANVAGETGEANTIRIGKGGVQKKTFIQGIFGATVANGVRVVVNSGGKLGTMTSSERFKEAIEPMNDASAALLALRPVTFRYKEELDPEGIPQFGLIAEEVEKVAPDLVVRDADGEINTVRYDAVNAMLLNEFLKQHQRIAELESAQAQWKATAEAQELRGREQQKAIETLSALVNEQAARIQRVAARLEISRPAPEFAAE